MRLLSGEDPTLGGQGRTRPASMAIRGIELLFRSQPPRNEPLAHLMRQIVRTIFFLTPQARSSHENASSSDCGDAYSCRRRRVGDEVACTCQAGDGFATTPHDLDPRAAPSDGRKLSRVAGDR